LVLRLLPVIALHSIGIGLDDMFQYDMLGRSIVSGHGYRWYAYEDLQMLEPYVDFDLSGIDYDPIAGVPTSFRAPLYPLFLASIYWIFGVGPQRFLAVRIVQALLGASLAPLIHAIALAFFPGGQSTSGVDARRIAKVTAWIVAVYPLLILYPFGLATENLFFPLVLLSFLSLIRLTRNPSAGAFITAGIFLGLSALTRSIILPFACLALLWVWFGLRHRRGVLMLAIAILMLIAPWIIRNSILHQRLVGIESSMGYNLYMGYHPESDGSFTFGVSLDLIPILDDAERDRVGTQQTIRFIQDDPARLLPLAFNRTSYFFGLEKRVLVYFYSNNFLGYVPPITLLAYTIVMLLPFVLILLGAPLGLALLPRQSQSSLLWLLLLAYIAPHVLILSEDRFHLALVPIITMLAVSGWSKARERILSRWHGSRSGKLVIGLALLMMLLLMANWSWELCRDAEKLSLLFGPEGNTLYLPY
jgi:hypothetical protein